MQRVTQVDVLSPSSKSDPSRNLETALNMKLDIDAPIIPIPCSSSSSVRWFRPGWERVLLTSLCLLSSAFSVLVAHRQMELETEVAELRAEMRTADLAAASEDVTIVRQRRMRREAAAGGDQGGASMPS